MVVGAHVSGTFVYAQVRHHALNDPCKRMLTYIMITLSGLVQSLACFSHASASAALPVHNVSLGKLAQAVSLAEGTSASTAALMHFKATVAK